MHKSLSSMLLVIWLKGVLGHYLPPCWPRPPRAMQECSLLINKVAVSVYGIRYTVYMDLVVFYDSCHMSEEGSWPLSAALLAKTPQKCLLLINRHMDVVVFYASGCSCHMFEGRC